MLRMTVGASAQNRLAKLVGSWSVEIATSEHGVSAGLLSFTRDGIVLADESPLPFDTAAHGVWVDRPVGGCLRFRGPPG
jgi:hypothetical protein